MFLFAPIFCRKVGPAVQVSQLVHRDVDSVSSLHIGSFSLLLQFSRLRFSLHSCQTAVIIASVRPCDHTPEDQLTKLIVLSYSYRYCGQSRIPTCVDRIRWSMLGNDFCWHMIAVEVTAWNYSFRTGVWSVHQSSITVIKLLYRLVLYGVWQTGFMIRKIIR